MKRTLSLLVVFAMSTTILNSQTAMPVASAPTPPVAKKIHKETPINGDVLVDDYAWLREKANPEVAKYLEAENAYTESLLAPTKPLQDKLYKEMLSHIKETDDSVPYKDGDYYYYVRTEQGKQYPIFCRRKAAADGSYTTASPEQVTIDQNELAKGEKFMQLGAHVPSDDGNWLAYSTDNTGFRQYTLHFKDLRTGKVSSESIPKTGSVDWANDNKTVFYTVEDAAKRQYRLYKHTIGEDPSKDKLIYEEKDEAFDVGFGKTRSRKFLVMEISSHTTSESRYIPADDPNADWKQIAPRIANEEYYVDHRGDRWYIRANKYGRNFALVSAPVDNPGREHWKVEIPHRANVMIEGVDAFADFLTVVERKNGVRDLRIHDFRHGDAFTDSDKRVAFPEQMYLVSPVNNQEWKTSTLRYSYESPITPKSIFDYDVNTATSKLLKQTEVPGGFDRTNYQLELLWATARDGVKVPVTVFYRKGFKKDGTAPLYQYAYGSYGYPLPVNFSSNRLALLDRGVVIALAHIRGGGDLGKPWHDQGRMMNKLNTFNDFIDVTEFLIKEKYAEPNRIAIEGGSAGGLLMGAVVNMRPDLYHVVISKVPFVDVMNTMLDASLPLTVGEYEEWGNPNKPADYKYMRHYSPYDNLKSQVYPNMLVKTSFNDSQVMYWEPAKYVAKLRTLTPENDHNVLLLKTNMAAGHGGASGRYDYLHEIALDYAFLLTQLGAEHVQ
jgi:oligopeptidase B